MALCSGPLSAAVDYASIVHSIVTVDFSRMGSGHSITLGDHTNVDWKGVLPASVNSESYSSNEYIWYDAQNDDTGNGHYTYPATNIFSPGSADIKQFRVTYTNTNVYIFLETYGKALDEPAAIFAIDTGTHSPGMHKFVEGDGLHPELGPAAEMGCDTMLFDYVLYAYNLQNARLWNASGQQIGSTGISGADNKIQFKSPKTNQYEISLPRSLVGNPSNAQWHFIVSAGFNDGGVDGNLNIMREIGPPGTRWQWHGDGGDLARSDDTGPDPDVYDLIGASKALQEKDLSAYQDITFNNNAGSGESLNLLFSSNPFQLQSGTLEVSFSLLIETSVTLKMLDLYGNEVGPILSKTAYPAQSILTFTTIPFDPLKKFGKKVKPGVYYIQGLFESANGTKTVSKMIRLY